MRNKMTWALAVSVALAAANSASAQGRRGGGLGNLMGNAGGVTLLVNASVQEELKLTDDQKTKLRGVSARQQEKLQEKMREMFQNLGGGGGGDVQDMMAKVQEEMAKFGAEALKEVATILKPEQMKRFKEIELQQSGFRAFTSNEELQKTLKLTNDQKDKFKRLTGDLQQDTMDLFQNGGFGNPEVQQDFEKLQKKYQEKALEALTAEQRKTYQDLQGKAFAIRMGPRGGGI